MSCGKCNIVVRTESVSHGCPSIGNCEPLADAGRRGADIYQAWKVQKCYMPSYASICTYLQGGNQPPQIIARGDQ